ncbi:hypothetical protein PHMEG_0006666 [Phytophthora megakarya]|uniref:Reverse transcriptase n=1 Tax=Phytophthora megakarya TaxID=4795 RepID=A0A225WND2_9STRA|nr:hypothetical protein PHMEG_0006666 [Phytophthora megakarya]
MSVQSEMGHVASDPLNDKCAATMLQKKDMEPPLVVEDQPDASELDLTWDSDQVYDECMAVLPEVPVTTEDVKIEDIRLIIRPQKNLIDFAKGFGISDTS